MPPIPGKTIVLGVTGGIAAYKAAELCRLLTRGGDVVRVVMTDAACQFITPLTMQALSGAPVARDLFDPIEEASIGHIRLADEADLVVVAPATADAIARMAAGMANDLLTAVVLATRARILLAPAMNVNMWTNPLTQANLRRLVESFQGRVSTVGPDRGELACGWVGEGRLIEPAEIAAAAARLLGPRDLAGRRVVVTAGPTYEPIDDVRFIGNRSSGKMGFAVAQAAARRGAEVVLIAGPVALATPSGVARRIDVEAAEQLHRATLAEAEHADVVVMTAAVADFRPASRAPGKLSRRNGVADRPLALTANPDVLADLGRLRHGSRPYLVGFAAEVAPGADELVARARRKLEEKRCDVIVANDVAAPGIGFGSDDNAATLVFAGGETVRLPRLSKPELADLLWNDLTPRLPPGAPGAGAPPPGAPGPGAPGPGARDPEAPGAGARDLERGAPGAGAPGAGAPGPGARDLERAGAPSPGAAPGPGARDPEADLEAPGAGARDLERGAPGAGARDLERAGAPGAGAPGAGARDLERAGAPGAGARDLERAGADGARPEAAGTQHTGTGRRRHA